MKVKIVLKVPMHNEKDKSKALQIVVCEEGVSSVSIGKENDELEVIGEGVDSVCLAKSLRKKFRFAHILTVGEVKPPNPCPPPCPPLNELHCPPAPPLQLPFYDYHSYDTGLLNCSIM